MKRKPIHKTEELIKSQMQKLGKKTHQKHVQAVVAPSSEISNDGIYENQKKLRNLYEKAVKNRTLMRFTKVKYKQHIYEIGEFLHLYDSKQKNPFVVRLHDIAQVQQKTQNYTILKVQWLLKKDDLPAKYSKYRKHFSVAEIFPSSIFEYVPIQSIMRKCYVIAYQQYQFLENAGDMIHYCRAIYNPETSELDPKVESFKKQCYCMMPVNPDLMYIQCQNCCGWFHNQCIVDKQKIESQHFICCNCEKIPKKK